MTSAYSATFDVGELARGLTEEPQPGCEGYLSISRNTEKLRSVIRLGTTRS